MPSPPIVHEGLHEAELTMLGELRKLRRSLRQRNPVAEDDLTLGQRVADDVAAGMGSWRFIIIQSVLLTFWVILNVTAWIRHWDPYPFILLILPGRLRGADHHDGTEPPAGYRPQGSRQRL
jgi:uncharacterized membrane protein